MSEFENKLIEEFKDKEYADAYVEEFLNQYIATQIKVLREQRNLTQVQLAEKANMQQVRISVLENVDYESWSIKTLKTLAEAFDVTLNVSFDTFSSTIKRMEGFSRESLERLSREDDLAKTENSAQQISNILDQIQPAIKREATESILQLAQGPTSHGEQPHDEYAAHFVNPQGANQLSELLQ